MTELRNISTKQKTEIRLLRHTQTLPGIQEDQQVPALPSLQQVPEQREANQMMRNIATNNGNVSHVMLVTVNKADEIHTAGPEGPGAPTSPSLPGAPCEEKHYPNQ